METILAERPVTDTVQRAIVTALADALGTDTTELQPVGEVVDLEAVEETIQSGHGAEAVFEYEGLTVHATNQRVRVLNGRSTTRQQ